MTLTKSTEKSHELEEQGGYYTPEEMVSELKWTKCLGFKIGILICQYTERAQLSELSWPLTLNEIRTPQPRPSKSGILQSRIALRPRAAEHVKFCDQNPDEWCMSLGEDAYVCLLMDG